jgi:thiol-disulfide isomerase/thioredoxin
MPFSRLLTAAVPALVLCVSSLRAADGWLTDFEKAKAQAAEGKRDLLIDFTGSDWCPPCMALDEEVFSKDAFKLEAAKNFVLMLADYPESKDQPEPLKQQNKKLMEEYGVNEFPTVLLADAAGRPYAATGYEEGGPAAYVEHLNELRKIRETRDTELKKAETLEGLEKAKAIAAALKEIDPGLVHRFYTKEVDAALAADKDDTTGLKKSREEFAAQKAFTEKVVKLDEDLQKLRDEEKYDEYTARIDKFIEDEKLTGVQKQEAMMLKLMVMGPDKLKEAEKLIAAVIAVDPKSPVAEDAKEMLAGLREMAEQIEKSKREFEEAGGEKKEE